jgi:hypothetical protein
MVVTVLKMGKATRTLIQVVLIQVRKELVVIRAVRKVVRKELVGMRVALTVVLKGLVVIKRVQVVIRMAQAQITAALMVTWDPVGIPMETPMVVLVKMETVTPVKKGTLMRKWRLG